MKLEFLPNINFESMIEEKARRLFMDTQKLKPTHKPLPIRPIQAFRLIGKYPAINENLELFASIDENLADTYINCQYFEVINYIIPTMTEFSVYAIGIIINASSGKSEMMDLIAQLAELSDEDSYKLLLDIVDSQYYKSHSDYNNLATVTHSDDRGHHTKFFIDKVARSMGFNDVVELFITTNNLGTLRGLHRQTGTTPQQKIIKVLSGKFNVRVIFPAGETFYDEALTSESATNVVKLDNGTVIVEYDGFNFNDNPIFVPKNALLGYVSLENDSKMLYIADNDFNGAEDEGFHYESFPISWNYDGPLTLSKRDLDAPKFINL